MGLAASQGRLLLLTARKSDLEFQAQQISQQRLLLATQQESIAMEYSDKVNNKALQVKVPDQTDGGGLKYENVTMADIATALNIDVGSLKLQTRGGKDVDYTLSKSNPADSAAVQGLLNGTLVLKDTTKATGEIVDLNTSMFKTDYYTQDDAAAKAKYDAAMTRVQALDKQLEVKLNQIETQHKAVETEKESVQKIIQNNIEGSFKYFS